MNFGSFRMEAPPDWTLSSIALVGPLGDSAPNAFQRNLFVNMERVGPGDTPETHLEHQIAALAAAGIERAEVSPPESLSLADGRPAVLYEQILMGQGGERVRQMQLIFVKDGIAHTAIASELDGSSFDSVRDELRTMLLSFE